MSNPETIVETKMCQHCQADFSITDHDRAFYDQMDVPDPTWCPSCRLMRRMAWCNEGVLYRNRCRHCSKAVVSYLPEDDERDVLCLDCYYSDSFDPLEYGQDIDWDRSILEQIHELELRTPHLYAAIDNHTENSEYMHCAGQSKNCYLTFHADYNEDCYYGYGIKRSKDCMDNHYCHESQVCFECIDVSKSSYMYWSQDCENCSNCWFVRDCIGCHECFLCVGLRNKEHCFLNEQLTPEVYKKRLQEFATGSYRMTQEALLKLGELSSQHAYKHLNNIMCEEVSGNYLRRCNNAHSCFDCTEVRDSKFCHQIQFEVDHCYDIYQFGIRHSFCYETAMTGIDARNLRFCYTCNNQVSDLDYCIYVRSSKDCFGCVALKKHQYCILNKQYSKQEYEALRTRLIEKMKTDGEWGEFFPIKYSESCYNETIAQLWYPKTREEVIDLGWRWQDSLPGTSGKETLDMLPDSIDDADQSILGEILCCETCNKNYRIVAQELAFYLQNKLPIPRECFDCRRKRRFDARVKRDMREDQCDSCSKEIATVYPADFSGSVVCEDCYREKVI